MYRTRLLASILGVAVSLFAIHSWSEPKVITVAEVEEFLNTFEELAANKDFALLSDMVDEEAFFRFNDGDFVGRSAVKEAFERTWASGAAVGDERYYLSDIKVLSTDYNSATATYTYNWEGMYGSTPFKITGRGTRVIIRVDGALRVVHEHLSPFPE